MKDYDYSQKGAYFITFCVKDRHTLLGKVVGEHTVLPQLSEIGHIVNTSIENITQVYNSVIVDKYIIMPNHVHMLIRIGTDYDRISGDPAITGATTTTGAQCAPLQGATTGAPTISRIIKLCKEYVTKQIGYSIWQKSFHDHVIRDEEDYKTKWIYIDANPARWTEDEYYE